VQVREARCGYGQNRGRAVRATDPAYHESITGKAEAKQRLISGASSFTIMHKQTLGFYPIMPIAADESQAA
jgi:hypothetical protein